MADSTLPNPDNESAARNTLNGIEFDDPRLYDLLDTILSDLYKAAQAINPRQRKTFGTTGSSVGLLTVNNFSATLLGNDVRLTWDALDGASQYEIRYKAGSNNASAWNTATSLLFTTTQLADINPVAIPLTVGQHTFLIKAIDDTGTVSTTAAYVVINVATTSGPPITITVIDNLVLLKWTAPVSTFNIAYYNVYKDGVSLGKMDGTFEAIFETAAGTFTYGVEAVDIVGNIGTRNNLVATVSKPPDFDLTDIRTSTFSGTLDHCQKQPDGSLLAAIDLTTHFDTHFSTPVWADINAAIAAGYSIWIQPTVTSGSPPGFYEERIDYGSVLTNVIATMTWIQNTLAGAVTVTPKIKYSTDDITYSAYATGDSLFISSFRYLKIKLEFTPTTDKGLVDISNLQIRLDVKRTIDSGTVSAVSTDAGGTSVSFNITFKNPESVTLTVQGTTLLTAVYTSLTGTGCKVLVFDGAGVRQSATVSWKVRGIV